MIITEENAFESADLIVRDPASTREQVAAAAAVLAQSPDWKQRILGREVRAGLYAQFGAELNTPVAEKFAQQAETVKRYLDKFPEMKRADWPAYPDFVPDFSGWKTDLALVAGFVVAFCAVVRWWPL